MKLAPQSNALGRDCGLGATSSLVASVPHSADAPVTHALALGIRPRGVVSELIHQATRIRGSAVMKAGEDLA